MLLRKINAGLSLLTTFFLLNHAVSQALRMLSGGRIASSPAIFSWILVGLMAFHAFVSIELVLSPYMEGEPCKCKKYLQMNVSTVVQRVSGIVMIPVTGLHIAGATGAMQPPEIVHAILPPLFFAVTLMHAAVSVSKALITLGVGNARAVKVVDVIAKILCGATLIACVVGFYLYTFSGVGK